MNMKTPVWGLAAAILLILAFGTTRPAHATIVEFQTVLGNFRVNLYDNITPLTVENFLEYVNNGAYTNTLVHFSDPGFVVQGGGYNFDRELPLTEIPKNPRIRNEPLLANVRGTIGMAKLQGRPNSATNQWFFNLADNERLLDFSDGGYAVFGEVMDDGMEIVDAIAALPVYDAGEPVTAIPLRNYSEEDLANDAVIGDEQLVVIQAVVVIDTTVDSAAGIEPPLNTSTLTRPPTLVLDTSSGSGATGLLLPAMLLLMVLRRRLSSLVSWL